MSNAQPSKKPLSQDGKTREREAYDQIHDIISESRNMKQLEKAVEKSIKLMSLFGLDEISQDKLDRHANRKYQELMMEERRMARDMIANKDF